MHEYVGNDNLKLPPLNNLITSIHLVGITTLFGKLKDHEHEISRFKSSEEDVKKNKSPLH